MSQSKKIPSPFTPLSSVVDHFIRNRGLEGKLQEYTLENHWDEIVGESISSHTQPDTIRFGVLHVLVDSSAWLQQLTFLKPELMQKVEKFLGTGIIKDIVLRLGRQTPSPR
jgi:predicted nucleic acid-binding Zn ribbon protein